jgi:hypothetical protein
MKKLVLLRVSHPDFVDVQDFIYDEPHNWESWIQSKADYFRAIGASIIEVKTLLLRGAA